MCGCAKRPARESMPRDQMTRQWARVAKRCTFVTRRLAAHPCQGAGRSITSADTIDAMTPAPSIEPHGSNGRREHLAIYAGSFDPITLGHLDVLRRARRLFDGIILGIGRNP